MFTSRIANFERPIFAQLGAKTKRELQIRDDAFEFYWPDF